MVGLCKDAGRNWTDKVVIAADVYLLEGRYVVDILEPSVKNGYHHILARQTRLMQTMPLQEPDLAFVLAMEEASYAVALFKVVMVGRLLSGRDDGVGSNPYQFAASNARQLLQTVNLRAVLQAYQYRILPTALSNDAGVLLLDEAQIAGIYRQVGAVDG